MAALLMRFGLAGWRPWGLAVALGLLALAAGLGGGGTALAAGGIRVVDSQAVADFPDAVALTLIAESGSEIVEVRVFFRASGSAVWQYTYADFQPGPRVVATSAVPPNRSSFISPGVALEYFYEIRDAAGDTLRTPAAIVEYLDGRFDWQRVSIGPLALLYYDQPQAAVDRIVRDVGAGLERIGRLVQPPASPPGIRGVIYHSSADAAGAMPELSRTTTDHGLFAGFAFDGQGVFVALGLNRNIILHEAAHLLLAQSLGEAALPVPAWLNEGLAQYLEPDARPAPAAQLRQRTRPLTAMRALYGTPDAIYLFYQKSLSVVAFLIDEYGEDDFRRLLDELRQGRATDAAMQRVYGFDIDGLDRRWAAGRGPDSRSADSRADGSGGLSGAADSGGDGGSSGGPVSPFAFFDLWLFAGLTLLAGAALLGRFALRRLSAHRAAASGAQHPPNGSDYGDWDDYPGDYRPDDYHRDDYRPR